MKTNTKILIAGIIIIVGFIALATIVIKIINENSQCSANPFVYGSRVAKEDQGVDITCSCIILGDGEKTYDPFSFNSEGVIIG